MIQAVRGFLHISHATGVDMVRLTMLPPLYVPAFAIAATTLVALLVIDPSGTIGELKIATQTATSRRAS